MTTPTPCPRTAAQQHAGNPEGVMACPYPARSAQAHDWIERYWLACANLNLQHGMRRRASDVVCAA